MVILMRVLIQALKNWKVILSLAGLIATTGFSFRYATTGVVDSIFKHYIIISLLCVTIILRELIKGYFKIKSENNNN